MYKISSALLPPCWFEDVIHQTLDLYEENGDLSNSPLIQWARARIKSGKFYAWCEDGPDLECCLLEKQKDLISTYENFKVNGYNGSEILIYFNIKGDIGYWDGNHRISILRYLGIVADLKVSITTKDPLFGDFPLRQVLLDNAPKGKWLYQPVDDPRVKDFNIQRGDSRERLGFILENLVGNTILDIGCSEGFFCRELSKKGYSVTGIEYLSNLCGAARYLTVLRNLKVDYINTKWEDYMGDSSRFDNILMLSTFHHTIKTRGIDQAFALLGKLKADRLFFELPMSGREVGFFGAESVPLWDFTGKTLVARVEKATGMKCAGSFSGFRPMFVFEKQSIKRRVAVVGQADEGPSEEVVEEETPRVDIGSHKFRLHVLGVPHTKTTKEYTLCAYTQKVFKLCGMMMDLGHEVYHYGAEGSNPRCTEHIDVVSDALQRRVYGTQDWKKYYWSFKTDDEVWTTFAQNAIREINKRKQRQDLLLVSFGIAQKPIADGVGLGLVVESGVGYPGIFAKYKVFESYAWMHYIYGKLYPNSGAEKGEFYDCVIPNFFDPEDFEFSDEKDDYYLFMGRLTARKGPHIAADIVDRVGGRLVVAGQGNPSEVGLDTKPHVTCIGTVDVKARSDLMRHAKAVIVPTLYLGPFEGVAIEANFCGTPVITTDFGVFTETVQHGKTGFRCRTMDDFVFAARNVEGLDRHYIREYAVNNYSIARARLMYEEYFTKLMDLFRGGWYEMHPERTQLDWLRRW